MNTQEYVFKLTAKIDEFTKNLETAAQKMTMTEAQGKAFARNLSRAMSSTSPEVQKLGRDMSALASQYNSQIAQFKHYINEIQNAGKKVAELSQVQATQAARVKETETKVAELTKTYNVAIDKQNAMQAAMEAGNRVKADVYMRVKNDAEQARKALEEMTAQLNEQQSALGQTENAIASWNNVAQIQAENAQNAAETIGASRTQMVNMSAQAGRLTGIATVFRDLASKARNLGTTLAGMVKSGFGQLTSKTRELVQHFRETVTHSTVLDRAVKKLTSSFGSFGHLLIRRFKRQIISEIFNGLKEGIANVARESSSFNAALSMMGGALKTFANALGSAFAPIMEAAAPIITNFVNFLTNAVSRVAQLTSAITGKDTFLKALPVNYDYAKSLDNTANSANKAAAATDKQNKAAQEYKKTVLSFDQLHKLDDNNSSSSETSSSSPAATEQKFESTKIDSKVKGIADQLAEAFKAHDWNTLGSMMAAGVNKAFSWIDNVVKWENCGEKITEVINGITGTFNSFVKNLDWKLIGKTFGDFVNTVINSVSLLATGIDWAALGAGLRDGVISFLSTVNWSDLGATIITAIQGMLSAVNAFVSADGDGNTIFTEIGRAIKDGLSGAIDALSETEWGETVGKVIDGIFVIFGEMFSDIEKWGELGRKVATNINAMIDELKPEDISTAINNFLDAVLAFVGEAFGTLNWQDIGAKIGECLAGIDWVDALKVAGLVLLATLVTRIPLLLTQAFTAIGAMLPALIGVLLSHPIVVLVTALLSLILPLIIEHWDEIVEWAKALPGKIVKWFKDRGRDIKNWWADVKKWATEKFENAKTAVKDTFDDIKEKVTGPIKSAWKFVTDKIDAIREALNFDGIVTTVTNALSGLGAAIKAPFETAWSFISPIIDAIKNFTPPSWLTDNFVTNGISAAGKGIAGAVGNVIDFFGFADGGFPEDGLFFANHGELVGGFSNGKTAVANNDQITGGISIAVADAVVPVLLDILGAVKSNRGGSTIEIDGERMARVITRHQKSIANRESAFA